MVNIIPEIKVGNIGTRLRVRMTKVKDSVEVPIGVESEREAIDLATAQITWIELEIPRGKRLPLLVATIIDAPNGLIEYIDSIGLFTVDGRWKMRGIVQFNSGNLFKGTWTGFSVGD